jgi:ankyrin repeat protein
MDEMSLYDAAKNNDVMGVKNILKSSCKVDINAENEAGITPLIEACINGNKEMVEILLDAGSPAQPAAGFRHTPLRGAVVCGHDHLISLLLSKGADPNALSEGNRTPLMGACFLRKGVPAEQSVKCVKELLNDQRTDASILNSFGESALDLAKIRGYTESIVLIEKVLNLEE